MFLPDHVAQLVGHGTDGCSWMSTDLLREDAGIYNAQALHSVYFAFQVDRTGITRWTHAYSPNWMIKCERFFFQKADEVIV